MPRTFPQKVSLTIALARSEKHAWLTEQLYLLAEFEDMRARGDYETLQLLLQDPISLVVLHDVRGRNGDRLTALQRCRTAPSPDKPGRLSGTLLVSLVTRSGDTPEHFVDRLMARKQAIEASLRRKVARIERLERQLGKRSTERQSLRRLPWDAPASPASQPER